MRATRFLERLRELDRAGAAGSAAREAWRPEEELRSILEHLKRLLNTRQGSVPIQPDYGIPDFTNLAGEGMAAAGNEMQRALRQVVQRYESRLSQVRVSFEGREEGSLLLRFRVEAVLTRDPKVTVGLDTLMSTDGKVRVKTAPGG